VAGDHPFEKANPAGAVGARPREFENKRPWWKNESRARLVTRTAQNIGTIFLCRFKRAQGETSWHATARNSFQKTPREPSPLVGLV